MARIVGTQQRSDIERDPARALARGRALDRMLAGALPARARGVTRAPHRVFNEMDDRHQLEAARRLNPR